MAVVVVCRIKGCIDTFWRELGWDSNAKPIRNRVRKAQALKSGTHRIKTNHQEIPILVKPRMAWKINAPGSE